MTSTNAFARRSILAATLFVVAAPAAACAKPQGRNAMAVYKTPTCPCCDAWVGHLRAARFDVTVNVLPDLMDLRSRHGMPDALASCHSALIAGYFIEGHVPAEDIRRLVAERPDAVGITVPGMPMGSPGMETPSGELEPYDTFLVLKGGATRVFARHNAPA